ncbi:hypothetical protein SDC9_184031 [bioreactor metagenome]|uniref:Uncharacterized protein n=1 Tax=bioreactor metagenome TaxID=1076179 RepID=A0A645HDT2_9ZZZZ
MRCSVSIRKSDLCLIPEDGYMPPVEGVGLLHGMWLFFPVNGRYGVKHSSLKAYVLDEKLGLIIERR